MGEWTFARLAKARRAGSKDTRPEDPGAITAAIPDLVPRDRLQAANSLNQLSAQGATFFGQAVGGVAFRLLGAPTLILVDGISYVLSAFSEAFIRLPAPVQPWRLGRAERIPALIDGVRDLIGEGDELILSGVEVAPLQGSQRGLQLRDQGRWPGRG